MPKLADGARQTIPGLGKAPFVASIPHLTEYAPVWHRCDVNPGSQSLQRVTRLIPLADVLACVDVLVSAAKPSIADLAVAAGRVVAADVLAALTVPPVPVALLDGWAVSSERVMDAGQYAPVPLVGPPSWAELGSALVGDADTIVPPDAVTLVGHGAEVFVAGAPGEGVLPVGGEVQAGEVLRRSGERIRGIDIALMRAAGVKKVQVRIPSVRILIGSQHIDPTTDTVGPLAARQVEAQGAVALLTHVEGGNDAALERALIAAEADAVILVGGTGAGRRDHSVEILSRLGRVQVHGIALSPGSTAAFGFLDACPVLLVPGRLDSAIAVLLTIGQRLLARLTGAPVAEPQRLRIARKISSSLGVAEVVMVRRSADELEPIARQILPLRALARADGWVLVPAQSEGYAPGSIVDMLPLP